jgi:dTDP-glucose 4,6-dehydratase
MKFMILGSNSFAGSSYIDFLLNAGYEVIAISRSDEKPKLSLSYGNNTNLHNLKFYKMDLNSNMNDIKNLISHLKPNFIIDFAGQGMVAESWNNPTDWWQTNLLAKIELIEFLRTLTWLERYVRISTPEVYGNTEKLITENSTYRPSTPYALTHATIDAALMQYHSKYGFPVTINRFANFYGPAQQLYRIIPKTIISLWNNKTLPLHGGGSSIRAFIYGTDVARAIDASIIEGKVGEIYHFSTEPFISIHDLVFLIFEKMNMTNEGLIEIVSDRPNKDSAYLMDSTKARSELGWFPKVSLDEGIQNTISYLVTNMSAVNSMSLEYIHKR